MEPGWHWYNGWWWRSNRWGWFCSLDVANFRRQEVVLEKSGAEASCQRLLEENQHLTQELLLYTREFDKISSKKVSLLQDLHGAKNTIAELAENLEAWRCRIGELAGELQSVRDASTERIHELEGQLKLEERKLEKTFRIQEADHAEHVKQVAARHQTLKTRQAEQLKHLAERLEMLEAEHSKQVAARDRALHTLEAEHLKRLAARDHVMKIKEAQHLQKLADLEHQFLRLTIVLQDLQKTHQQQDEPFCTAQKQCDEAFWIVQGQSIHLPEMEQVSSDQHSAHASELQPPLPPPPPSRMFIDAVNPPPPPFSRADAGEVEPEHW